MTLCRWLLFSVPCRAVASHRTEKSAATPSTCTLTPSPSSIVRGPRFTPRRWLRAATMAVSASLFRAVPRCLGKLLDELGLFQDRHRDPYLYTWRYRPVIVTGLDAEVGRDPRVMRAC